MKFHQHPLNAVISDFQLFLWEKRDSRQISGSDIEEILQCAQDVTQQAGLPHGPEADEVTLAVYRQQLHVMKKRLVELHPELADEVRNRTSGYER